MDLAREYDRFAQLLKDEKPDTIVHFADWPTADVQVEAAEEVGRRRAAPAQARQGGPSGCLSQCSGRALRGCGECQR